MLESIPHITVNVMEIAEDANYTYIYVTDNDIPHIGFNIWTAFFVPENTYIPVQFKRELKFSLWDARKSFVCDLQTPRVSFPENAINAGDNIKLYTDSLDVLEAVCRLCKYDRGGMIYVLEKTNVDDYNLYVKIIQYAMKYNVTQILDGLSNDARNILEVTMNTNHRM